MPFLQSHHMTDLYFTADEMIPEKSAKPSKGRPSILSDSEIITILMRNTLCLKQKTIIDLYRSVRLYHQSDFPGLPKYRGFPAHCHRLMPVFYFLSDKICHDKAPIRILDATMLPVCKLKRADDHKVAKGIADFGKNWQGWHYGFKLHAAIDLQGFLCSLSITPASIYDAQKMPDLLNKHARLAVGDTLYGRKDVGRVRNDYHCPASSKTKDKDTCRLAEETP